MFEALLILIVVLIGWGLYQAAILYVSVGVAEKLVQQAKPFAVERGALAPRILVLGDSTAAGVGASDSAHSTAGLLGREYMQFSLENYAVSGAKVADVLKEQIPQAHGKYELILIQAGANDILYFSNLAKFRSNLRALLSEVSVRAPRVVLLSSGNIGLAPIFIFPFSQLMSYRTRLIRRIILDETQRAAVAYVDLYQKRGRDIFANDIANYYAPDRLHLSDAGYAYWYSRIKETLQKSFADF